MIYGCNDINYDNNHGNDTDDGNNNNAMIVVKYNYGLYY